jgi:hypothetical protein
MGIPQRSTVAGGWRWLAIGLVLLLASCGRAAEGAATSLAATAAAKAAGPGGCRITRPPDPPFVPPVPPAPASPSVRGGAFWYGTPALWTSVQRDGNWSTLPYQDGAYTQKVFWWSQGNDWRSPLTVTGRRTDGSAPPLRASTATNAYAGDIGEAILVGVDMPSAGCWQITGHLKGVDLSFVVWVS